MDKLLDLFIIERKKNGKTHRTTFTVEVGMHKEKIMSIYARGLHLGVPKKKLKTLLDPNITTVIIKRKD